MEAPPSRVLILLEWLGIAIEELRAILKLLTKAAATAVEDDVKDTKESQDAFQISHLNPLLAWQ